MTAPGKCRRTTGFVGGPAFESMMTRLSEQVGGPARVGDAMSAVTVDAVTCRFGTAVALDAVCFAVLSGSVIGLLGPNGSGKTTILDVICGLLAPAAGRVEVFGREVVRANLRAIRASLGVVPQETALYDELSARENLRFAAALYDVDSASRRVEETLELVGLAARAHERCDHLSGGMRRRLVIARALLHAPRLLILDEPTLGVDVDARHEIWRHLQRLRAGGTTVLLATNYLDEATTLCDRVVVLRSGRVVAEGTPADLVGRAGQYVELECRSEDVARVARALRGRDPVRSVEEEASLVRVQVSGDDGAAEEIIQVASVAAALRGFRTRPPDLAEILRALE